MDLDAEDVPTGWAAPSPDQCADAKAFAMRALADSGEFPVSGRLEAYYKLRGNYAGSTFTRLQDSHPSSADPTRMTVADLHAVSLLSVRVPPAATRALIDDVDGHASAVSATLAGLHRLGTRNLRDADASVLDAMDAVASALMDAFQPPDAKRRRNPWVLVAKLAARKAPNLFPVRDNIVCTALGLLGPGKGRGSWRIDWQVYRALVRDDEVRFAIEAAQDGVNTLDRATHGYEQDELRVLDAAMWTHEISSVAASNMAGSG